ncbi:hypothetical protein DEI89_16935 [Curtobacterium sp. MCBD17_030]|nr:hypothetical protein DEI89_16935 [Curtobacterium sp. MCBD17_030]
MAEVRIDPEHLVWDHLPRLEVFFRETHLSHLRVLRGQAARPFFGRVVDPALSAARFAEGVALVVWEWTEGSFADEPVNDQAYAFLSER